MVNDALTPKEMELFKSLKAHDYERAVQLIPIVENVNAVDPEFGMTALHWAASHGVVGLLAIIHKRQDVDELALDRKGRTASDLAWVVAENEELSAKLIKREKIFAKRTGKSVFPKMAPS